MLLRGRCYERVKIYTKNPTRSPQTASKQYQSQKQGRTDVANRGEGETTSHGNNSPSAASFFFTPLSHVRRSNRRKQGAEKCGTPEDFFFFCLRTRLRRQRSVIASVPAMALAMALGRAATREFCWCFRYRRLPDGQPTADILAVLVCRAVASVRPPQDAHRPPLHRRGSAASDWPAARPCQPQQRRSIGVERG